MLKFHAFEVAALEGGADFGFLDAALGLESGNAVRGEKQGAFFGFDDGIFEIRMKGERAIVRQSPGRGGPDDGANVTANFRRIAFAAAHDAKLHPDRRAGVVLIFDLGFGEGGVVVDAPIDGLAAAVNIALLHEVKKSASDGGLIFMAHGEIGIIPPAENAEALEILLVLLDVARGELTAELSKFSRWNFSLSAKLFFHLRFDGQAVAVPSGDVWSVMPCHAPGPDNQIFEDFVEAGAQVDFPGGVGRTVMQDKERLAFASFEDALIDVGAVPGFELLGLILRQTGLHGKLGFRKVESFLQFEWFGHWSERSDTPDLRACFRALALVYRTKDFVRTSRTVVPLYGEKHWKAV